MRQEGLYYAAVDQIIVLIQLNAIPQQLEH